MWQLSVVFISTLLKQNSCFKSTTVYICHNVICIQHIGCINLHICTNKLSVNSADNKCIIVCYLLKKYLHTYITCISQITTRFQAMCDIYTVSKNNTLDFWS